MQRNRVIAAVAFGLAALAYVVYALASGGSVPENLEPVDESAFPEWRVSASGIVVPAKQAKLSFTRLGKVKRVAVHTGETVRAGQVLVELDSGEMQADVDAAQGALDVARADLSLVEAGSRSEEIEGAEAAYRGALARYNQTEAGATRAELESAAADVQLARERLARAQSSAKAQETVAVARVDSAKAALERLEAGPSAEDLKSAELALEQARNSLWSAQIDRDGAKGIFGGDNYQSKAAEARVAAATTAVDVAATNLLKIKQGPTPEELRIARASVVQAEAELETVRETRDAAINSAESALDSANARLAQLSQGATVQEKTIAASAVDSAKAVLALRQAGPSAPALDAAQARVRQAEGVLRRARAELEQASLLAPFDATVAAVAINEGETPAPGAPVLTIGDVGSLRIETTDLRETSVARVRVGQSARTTFDALPEREFQGKVTSIAPMATAGSGGTNYTVTIELEKPDPSLRWGMTANVEIDTR